ncbi:MAG: methyltransferase domain-containing protein [Gemmatimonadota bacterium]|jgi:SAM-dependent methyltransferase
MTFRNTYEEARRAAAYDELSLGSTYAVAFDNLPSLFDRHVPGRRALDFGCGTGRSARFLKELGFSVVGVDVAPAMVSRATERDPDGDYRVMEDGDFGHLPPESFDLVLSAFTFDNVPGFHYKVDLFRGLGRLLGPDGVLVNVVSTADLYTREWVTFTTEAYPENHRARCGDVVLIRTTQYGDTRPVEDILWPHEDYLRVFAQAGLDVVEFEQPLARGDEGVAWKSELTVPPWSLYVLRRGARGSQARRVSS